MFKLALTILSKLVINITSKTAAEKLHHVSMNVPMNLDNEHTMKPDGDHMQAVQHFAANKLCCPTFYKIMDRHVSTTKTYDWQIIVEV